MRYQIKGLDCPNCAAKLERGLRKIAGLETVTISFVTESIELPEEMLEEAERAIATLEPEARIMRDVRAHGRARQSRQSNENESDGQARAHDHREVAGLHIRSDEPACECGHDHSHAHAHDQACECGHDHGHRHSHSKSHSGEQSIEAHDCDCGHDHSDAHEHDQACGCGHDHGNGYDGGNGDGDAAALPSRKGQERAGVHGLADEYSYDRAHSRDGDDSHGHAHGHDHDHELEQARGQGHSHEHDPKGRSLQIPFMVISAVLLFAGIVFNARLRATPSSWAEYAVLIPAYLLVGWPVIRKAVRNLTRGDFFDENALMSIASIGAIAIHELPEAAAVMVFYSIGEYLQERSVDKSRRSIAALLDIRPEYANLKDNGELARVSPEDVEPGDIIVIKPGERVPLDGEVLEGASDVDTSALTGESVPRDVAPGDGVLAGMVNGQGLLTVKVTRPFGESAVSRILELVQNAASRKAPTEQFITSFSRYYTPAVVFGALAVAVLPPLLVPGQIFSTWIYRALAMLVISCPCALVISVPLGYFGGIGGAASKGILVKGANFLEALARTDTVVFDKTGTLTKGVFKVSKIIPAEGFTADEVLFHAAAAETHSSHPIAQSIRQAYGKDVALDQIEEYKDVAGRGVTATIMGRGVLVGKDVLLGDAGIAYSQCEADGTVVYVSVDGVFAGCIDIADEIKGDAALAVTRLRKLGVRKIAMLTGDKEAVAEKISRTLNLDGFYSELLPEDKVEKVEKMKSVMPNPKKDRLVFVGDGINDAPVIARADVGVAMGGLGSDAAIEAADVVLMEDAPSKLATAISISRWTRRIIQQNVGFALGVKGVFLVLGAVGVASIWEAVFADVGVALIAVFNATRALRYKGE